MKKTLFIHVGTHKTGSSSIQESFFRSRGSLNLKYFDFGESNHSHVIATLFLTNPYFYHFHRNRGKDNDEVDNYINHWSSVIDRQISSSNKEVFFISAEDLCTFTEEEFQRMKAFFDQYFECVKIICYVRPPLGFMQSQFQQRLKNGVYELSPEKLYLSKRKLIEILANVFGVDNCIFREFKKSSLLNGDVVDDIAFVLGEDKDNLEVVKINEGLSAEAVAILFLYHNFKETDTSGEERYKLNKKILALVENYGQRKLVFGSRYRFFIENNIKAEIKWLKERIGFSSDESFIPEDNSLVVNYPEDLVTYGKAVFPDFVDYLVNRRNHGNVKVIDVIRLIESFCR